VGQQTQSRGFGCGHLVTHGYLYPIFFFFFLKKKKKNKKKKNKNFEGNFIIFKGAVRIERQILTERGDIALT
jgi:hypothetical protein